VDSLLEPLETVLGNRQTDKHLRVSALSIIGIACQTCPAALTDRLWSLMNWILTILDFEKEVEIRRGKHVIGRYYTVVTIFFFISKQHERMIH
jgi:hypothetical protein